MMQRESGGRRFRCAAAVGHAAAFALALGGMVVAFCPPSRAGGESARGEKRVSNLALLQVKIDPEEVDLQAGELTLRMSRPAARVTLQAVSLSGAVLARVEQRFDAAPHDLSDQVGDRHIRSSAEALASRGRGW